MHKYMYIYYIREGFVSTNRVRVKNQIVSAKTVFAVSTMFSCRVNRAVRSAV